MDVFHSFICLKILLRSIINLIFTAKEEALNELRNAHPNQEISVHLPDHCSEHLEKINQVYISCLLLFVCYI